MAVEIHLSNMIVASSEMCDLLSYAGVLWTDIILYLGMTDLLNAVIIASDSVNLHAFNNLIVLLNK